MSIVKSRMLRTRERARKTHGWQRGLLKRIVEFTMIVVGVLVALGGNAWWENREDARLAGDYRERLAMELRVNLFIADQVLLHTTRVQAATDSVQSFFEGGDQMLPASHVLINLYNATRRSTLSFTSSTFDDLTNTGNLRLVRDPDLRSQLAGLYGQLRRYTQDWFGSEYRAAARKAIPIRLQFRVRDECGAIGGVEWTGCELAGDMRWAEAAAEQLRGDLALRGAYRVQAHEIAVFVRDLTTVRDLIRGLLVATGVDLDQIQEQPQR